MKARRLAPLLVLASLLAVAPVAGQEQEPIDSGLVERAKRRWPKGGKR